MLKCTRRHKAKNDGGKSGKVRDPVTQVDLCEMVEYWKRSGGDPEGEILTLTLTLTLTLRSGGDLEGEILRLGDSTTILTLTSNVTLTSSPQWKAGIALPSCV